MTRGMVFEARLQTSRTLTALGRVAHGFTTRLGGVSTGVRASLDLADPDVEARGENWRRALLDLGGGEANAVAVLEQVHGDGIVEVTDPLGPHVPVAQADASFTTRPGVVLAVRTADCVPVLLAGPGVVAAAHSGWRGTAVDIVGKLVTKLQTRLGVDPASLVAAVGPAISRDAYEVGPEVVDGLRQTGLADDVFGWGPSPRNPDERFVVDLKRAVRAQLARRGVRSIEVSDACTLGDDAFFSVRRDGSGTGRQAGLIARTDLEAT